MNIDLIAYSQAFLNESVEMLDQFGSRLSTLKMETHDPEQLNVLAEIIGSIHNGATTFGMADAVELSALQKALVNHLQRREIALSANTVDILMLSRDALKSRLINWQNGRRSEASGFSAICDLLRKLVASANHDSCDAPSVGDQAAKALVTRNERPERRVFRIEFAFRGPQWSLNNLLAQLREFGKVTIVTGSRFMHAELVVLESCCIDIETTATKEQIWESLAFVVDPTSIKVVVRIETVDAQTSLSPIPATAEKNQTQSIIPLRVNSEVSANDRAKIDHLIALANKQCNTHASLITEFSAIERARHASLLYAMSELNSELLSELDSLKCAMSGRSPDRETDICETNANRARRAG